MKTQSLNEQWIIQHDNEIFSANVPCSVYSVLTDNKIIPDPYIGENQYNAIKYSEFDYVFTKKFTVSDELLISNKIYLEFDGLDTIADIYLNDVLLGNVSDMHRNYRFEIKKLLIKDSEQIIKVKFTSPIKYIKEKNSVLPLWGVSSTMEGYPHIRKAHFMYGWDWGITLPDMGIWRDVRLVFVDFGRIESVYTAQIHENNNVALNISCILEDLSDYNYKVSVALISPENKIYSADSNVIQNAANIKINVNNPMLWYPKGYGEQPLYKLKITLKKSDKIVDEKDYNIGLRKIEISRNPDEYGEEFTFVVNDIKIFAMGANYIPEDQIICHRSKERTEKLLTDCVNANYNMIRVWGGGFYPDDYFFDFCDKNGLLVWHDFMFACSVYSAIEEFCENIREEVICNVKRIRNHPCLALWCGNNEIESAWQYWGLPDNEKLRNDYLKIFEDIIPNTLKKCDPNTFYWPSSPSSGGGFNDSGAKNKGDIHYWEIWHGLKPITDFQKYLFRFCSEYGFESIPEMKTVRYFSEDKDLNLTSPVMEAHQKCEEGNEKLMYYIAQMVHYPCSFSALIYGSQYVQAEAIRQNVVHMRQNRGICMGSLYWQVNDSNPVISWSSIDYFGRWKALHYYAKRFYAPLLISEKISNNEISLNVSSEMMEKFEGKINYKICKNTGEIVYENEIGVTIPPLSAKDYVSFSLDEILSPEIINEKNFKRKYYLEFSLTKNNEVFSSYSALFVNPKSFEFLNPDLKVNIKEYENEFEIEINTKAFAKCVKLSLKNYDVTFNDNYFDISPKSKIIKVNKSILPKNITSKELENEIEISSYFTEMEI